MLPISRAACFIANQNYYALLSSTAWNTTNHLFFSDKVKLASVYSSSSPPFGNQARSTGATMVLRWSSSSSASDNKPNEARFDPKGGRRESDLVGRTFAEGGRSQSQHDAREWGSSSDGLTLDSNNPYGGSSTSLYCVMQSSVPEPFNSSSTSSSPSNLNMPGGGVKSQQRFVYGSIHDTHPSKQNRNKQNMEEVGFAVPLSPSKPKLLQTSEVVNQDREALEVRQQMRNVNNGDESLYEKSSVDLSSHMQSSVPEPYIAVGGYPTSHNMPGGDEKLKQKYLSDSLQKSHPSRHYTTFRSTTTQQNTKDVADLLPCPQGIQGDDCDLFKHWMENCLRYGLPNCSEQMENLMEGRKTIQQIFSEQQRIIEEVAQEYREKSIKKDNTSSVSSSSLSSSSSPIMSSEGNHESPVLPSSNPSAASSSEAAAVSPQGVQGDYQDYKLLLDQCYMYQFHNCKDHYQSFKSGHKTIEQVFHEQEQMVRRISLQYQQLEQQTRSLSSTSTPSTSTTAKDSIPGIDGSGSSSELTRRQKLQRAVKEYGSTVMVFHITMSLMSLGSIYFIVSSGIDLVGILTNLGVGESVLQSRIASGASTFVVAYAVHKVFAPVRIGITLSATPLIVRYLRLNGILKPPKVTQPAQPKPPSSD